MEYQMQKVHEYVHDDVYNNIFCTENRDKYYKSENIKMKLSANGEETCLEKSPIT